MCVSLLVIHKDVHGDETLNALPPQCSLLFIAAAGMNEAAASVHSVSRESAD